LRRLAFRGYSGAGEFIGGVRGETVNGDAGSPKGRTQALFNGLAEDYDAAGPGNFAHFGHRLVDVVGVEPGHRVLDVATGRGAVLFPAAERAGTTGHVIGIDFAEAMVRATETDAKRRGLVVQIFRMDAEHLDFPDAEFDRVLCGFGVMFFPDLEKALGEFRRVLKAGGRLGVSTWQVSQNELLAQVLGGLGIQQGPPPGWITDPDRLADLLRQAGFQDVQVSVDAEDFCYADLDQYWENARGTGQRPAIDGLNATQRERARTALAERLRSHQQADGIHVVATALLATATR